MRTLAGVLVGIGFGMGALASAADAGTLGSVRAPDAAGITEGRSTAVAVRVAPGARLVRAAVDGRALRLRRDGRTLRGRVPRRRAGAGLHELRVELRRGGRREVLRRRFAVAGRRARLVRLAAPRRARRAPVHVRVRQNREELLRHFTVRLNGRVISNHFVDSSGFAERDRLSARHGLRHGVNRLVVLAVGPGGTWDRERRRIVLRRGVPIPDAGRDRRVLAGRPVPLGTDGPRDIWQLVARPPDSRAAIRDGRLMTDVPGRYRVGHVRSRGGQRSGADVMDVQATPDVPPIGLPIDTVATQGGQTGIQLGNDFHARDAGTFQMLQIDRATLDVVDSQSYPADDTGSLTDMAADFALQPQGSMFVIAADATGFTGQQSTGWGGLGVYDQVSFGGGAISVIGIVGLPPGQGWINQTYRTTDGTVGALEGYLSLDSTETNFQFTPPDAIGFDTNTTSAGEGATSVTATVGTQTYSGSVPSGQAGFLVAAIDAGTLEPIDSKSFATVGTSDDSSNQQALAWWLEYWSGTPWALILVQSIGHVKPTTPTWDAISDQLRWLGGTEHIFNTVDGGYSLLGGADRGPGAETSTTLNAGAPGPVGTRLTGIVERDNQFGLWPALHGAATQGGDVPDFDLPQLAYQAATPWPNGTSGETGAANAYIAQTLGLPPDGAGNYDVRDLYSDENFDFDALVSAKGFTCPDDGGSGFSKQQCDDMVAQFSKEQVWLNQLNKYLGIGGLVQAPITDAQTGQSALLNGVAQNVENAVKPPSGGLTVDWETIVEEVIDDVAVVAGFIPGGEAAAGVLGVFASAFGIAGSFSKNSDGSLATQLTTDADQLALQADQSFDETISALGQLRDLIATDYGKLDAFTLMSAGTNPAWDIDPKDSRVQDAWQTAAKQQFYAALLGVAYYSIDVPTTYCQYYESSGICDAGANTPTTDARTFNCFHQKIVSYNTTPYSDSPSDDSGQFQAVTGFASDMSPTYTIQVIVQSGTTWTMPSASLLDQLYAVPANATDLNGGFAKVELWPAAWPGPLSYTSWVSEYGGCTK